MIEFDEWPAVVAAFDYCDLFVKIYTFDWSELQIMCGFENLNKDLKYPKICVCSGKNLENSN